MSCTFNHNIYEKSFLLIILCAIINYLCKQIINF